MNRTIKQNNVKLNVKLVKCFIFYLMNIKNTQVLTHRFTHTNTNTHSGIHEAITSRATTKIALWF
jgi:hypothetical protein